MRSVENLDTCAVQSRSVCCRCTSLFSKFRCVCLFTTLGIAFLLGIPIKAKSDPAPTCLVCGEVIDAQQRSRLTGVVVHIVDVGKSAQTDADGQFEFDDVPEGKQTFRFMKADYQPLERVIDVDGSDAYIQIALTRGVFQLKPIEVFDETGDLAKFERTTDLALKDADLQKRMGMTLAGTLSDEAGLSQRMMGRATARPVIRGLGGDRLLILENGARTGDKSASSADHAVSIDPTTADRVEITRGPGSLIYGSSTLGGVINVKRDSIPEVIPRHPNMDLTFQGESVNSGWTATTGLAVPLGPFAGQLQWNRRVAADTQTPIGTLRNTELSNVNFSTGAAFIQEWGHIGFSGGSYRSDYGIPGSPDGHIDGIDIALDRERYETQLTYRFNRPWFDKLDLQTVYTRYQHQELETGGVLGVEFGVLTYNFSAMAHVLDNAIVGVSGEYRDHATGGFYWTPHTREFALAGFYLNQYEFDRFTLQGAARYDVRRAEPFRANGIVVRAGTVQRRDFGGISGAASGIYHWTDRLSAGTTIMKTFRAPGIEELYSDGPHLAIYSYEIGNVALEPENGLGFEVFGRYVLDKFNLNLTFFQNRIFNYLTPSNTGEKEWGSGAAGWLWIYQYTGRDVVMNGAEVQVDGEMFSDIHLQFNVSYVRGTLEADSAPLERMPPLKGKFVLSYKPAPFHFHLTTHFAGSQTRLGEFETPTDGYRVYDLGCYLNFSQWDLENMLVFEVENLLDTAYREHLSRIKEVMPEPGRNVKLLYKLGF